MGTTAQKLEYLGTTKSQLKDMIAYGYPEMNGKNLLGISKYLPATNEGITISYNETDGAISLDGTTTSSSFFLTVNSDPIVTNLPSGSYTLSIQSALTFDLKITNIVLEDDTSGGTYSISAGETSKTFTVSKAIKSYRIYASGLTSGTAYHEKLYLQLESGSTATSFEKYIDTERFRSYPDYIKEAFLEALRTPDTLFTNLPKVSGTGSVISLNDTANAPMRIELGATELTQAGTPSPSSPQQVHTISGDNTLVVCGKNLFDGSRNVNSTFTASVSTALEHFKATGEYATGYCDNTNKINAYAGTYETCFIQVAPNTKYRLSSQGAENNGFSCIICLDNNGNSLQASSNWQGANYTINTPAGTKYLMFSPRNANVMYVQLEYGETTSTYTPYISQEADIDLKSKNLYNRYDLYGNYFINTSNGIPSTNNVWVQSNYIAVKPNTKYTISSSIASETGGSFEISEYDSSNTWVSSHQYGSANIRYYTFTTGSTTNVIRVGYRIDKYRDIQLELGENATSYEEYYDYGFMGSIGNYENKPIRTSGKNLANLVNGSTTASDVSVSIDNQVLKLNGTVNSGAISANNAFWKNIKFTVNEAGYYKVSLTNAITGTAFGYYLENSSTMISPSNQLEIGNYTLGIYIPANTVFSNFETRIQIEKVASSSSSATDYEPYGSNEWYIKKNIGKVVLDGTQGTISTPSTNRFNIDNALQDYVRSVGNKTYMCNGYTAYNQTATNGDFNNLVSSVNYGFNFTSGNSNTIRFKNTDCSTTTDFQNSLTSNPITLYYVLATPTYTQITGTLETQLENVYQKLLSYDGTTNISQINNDLSFNMSVQAIEV